MLTTIPLSDWMSNNGLAFAAGSRQDIVSRKSPWSKQVESVYRIDNGDEAAQMKRSDDEVYLENSASIALLLLEQMLTLKETSQIAIDMDTITVTIESNPGCVNPDGLVGDRHESCIIKYVNVVTHNIQGKQQTTFLQSLGVILLKLFTRQNILPNCEDLLTREEEMHKQDESGDFQSAMLKALSILDDEGGDDFAQRGKQHRPDTESCTLSKIRNQYPTLPTSICRLASDLLDEPTRTTSSFTSLNDVYNDLEQMVLEPDLFLHERTFTDVRLNFGNRVYGRKAEVSQLMDIANDISCRRETASLEIISIGGYSGSGKSFLVKAVGGYLSSHKWIFIRGKFDRMRQRDSLSVVISAFENFCGTLQKMKHSANKDDLEFCSRVSSKVMGALGHDGVLYLSQIISGLKTVIDLDSGSDSDISSNGNLNGGFDTTPVQTANEALMSQHKREYTLCIFVEAILGAGRQLLLFYDDVQWADPSTLQFLRKLLKHLADRKEARKNIMFVQAFRDDEVSDADLLSSNIESHDSVNVTKIKLDGFSKTALNDIISPVLCLPRRITSPLAEIIHQKTMGNIFFVIEFMKTLESPDKNILTFSLAKRQWIWDSDTIAVMTISDNVAGLLIKKILCIEKSLLDALIVASCFGFQVNTYVMELLNGMRGVPDIVQNLGVAVDEGLLEKAGPLYQFAHDSIQQSVYELIPKQELIQLHVDIGLMLISKGGHASKDMVEEIFSSAVGHINMSLPNTTANNVTPIQFTPSQHIVFAKLNLKAGQKAAHGKFDFSAAEVHFKAGVSFLPENSWSDHYELTLQIFDEYVNVLFVQRNFEEMHFHVDIILEKAKCIGDKIKAHELLISVLTLKGTTAEALDHARSVLDLLGFPFPVSINSETVAGVMNSLSSMTMAFTPDHLRSFPLMTERVPLQAMKIMSAVHMPYSFSNPVMFQMMACQMMQLTIKHGLCADSSEAFANFGYCLNTVFKNYDAGYRMGKLAQVILERFKASNRYAKVHFVIYGFLCVWKEPLQATVEGLKNAVSMGLSEGDFKNALFDQVILNRQMFIAGYKLTDVRDRLLSLCRDMTADRSKQRFYSGFNPVLGDLYFVMSLMGENEDEVCSMFNISREENDRLLMAKYSASNNAALVQIVYYHRLAKAFWFRDYATALECCNQYSSYTETRNLLRVTDIVTQVIKGLSSFILSRRKNESGLIAKGKEALLGMQSWARLGSKWNAENKAYLLEAEFHYSNGDFVRARTAYELSIETAKKHRFIHEQALGHELYGMFCVEVGDVQGGNDHLQKACELYEQWGAKKKAAEIFSL